MNATQIQSAVSEAVGNWSDRASADDLLDELLTEAAGAPISLNDWETACNLYSKLVEQNWAERGLLHTCNGEGEEDCLQDDCPERCQELRDIAAWPMPQRTAEAAIAAE